MKESYLLTGKLETTNEAYAIAKIAGVKMCEYYNKQYGTNYKSLMPVIHLDQMTIIIYLVHIFYRIN